MRVTKSTIDIYDPGFHIALLLIRLQSILARDGLVAVIGKMAGLGNRASIYLIETEHARKDTSPVRPCKISGRELSSLH